MFLISRDSTPHMPFSISRLPRLLRFYKTKFSPSSRCQKFQPIPKKKRNHSNKNINPQPTKIHHAIIHIPNKNISTTKINTTKFSMLNKKKKKIHNQNHMSKKVFHAQNHNQKIFHDQNHHQKISMIKITTKIFHDPTLILP